MTETLSGTGNGYNCTSNTGAAAIALWAACNRINKIDNTHLQAQNYGFLWRRAADLREFVMLWCDSGMPRRAAP